MRKLLIFMVLVLFLAQAPLSLQEEEKEDTILMNGQEILISGQQMSQKNQQVMAKRIAAIARELSLLSVTLEEALGEITEKRVAQHKEEQKLLKTIVANQQQILNYQTQLKKDRKTGARDIKIAVRETARLLKEFKEVYEKE